MGGEMNRLTIGLKVWLTLLVVCFAGIVPVRAHTGHAQYALGVDVSAVEGQLIGENVLITGKVTNNLPWPVTDIRVLSFFEETADFGSTDLDRLESGAQADFQIIQEAPSTGTTFFTVVGAYAVQSENVNALLERYNAATEDPVLQEGIAQAFETMTIDALPELLGCIDVKARPSALPTMQQELHDLMCLEGVRNIGGIQSAQAVVDLLAWYEQQGSLDLIDVQMSLLLDEYTPIRGFPILQDLSVADVNLRVLAQRTLTSIGPAAVPALLYAGKSASPVVVQIAEDSLASLEKTTPDAILSESNPAILEQIVVFFQEFPDPDAVLPLLNASQRLNDEELSTQIEACILSYGDAAVEPLFEGLLSKEVNVVSQAEAILYKIAPGREAVLQSMLEEKGFPSTNAEPDLLVMDLRAAADAQIQARVQETFSRGWEAFQAGDCRSAITIFEEMYIIRDRLPEYEEQVSQAYACQLTNLEHAGQVNQALQLVQEGLAHMPDHPTLNNHLVSLYHAQANASLATGDRQTARDFWQKVLAIDAQNQAALRGLGRLTVLANWLYLGIGGLGMAILLFLGKSTFAQENEHE
jgi:tetratricopeptide (TPR) repeat protein